MILSFLFIQNIIIFSVMAHNSKASYQTLNYNDDMGYVVLCRYSENSNIFLLKVFDLWIFVTIKAADFINNIMLLAFYITLLSLVIQNVSVVKLFLYRDSFSNSCNLCFYDFSHFLRTLKIVLNFFQLLNIFLQYA